MIILGIDPGLGKTGWAIVETIGRGAQSMKLLASGLIKTEAKSDIAVRLHEIHKTLLSAIKLYAVETSAIEDSFVNKNPHSSLKLSQARGAIILTLNLAGLPVTQYSPAAIKKAIVGDGRADKEQVAKMLQYVIPMSGIKSLDISDAIAVAVCHGRMRLLL